MRTAIGHGTVVVLLYALLWLCVPVAAQTEGDMSSSVVKDSSTVSSKNSSSSTTTEHHNDSRHTTCQSGTVNYITHSLPQQCLTRSTPTTTNSTTSLESTTTSASSTSVPQDTSTTSTITQTASVTQSETEFETDSPLDNANFLSFEEWKKQNLEKVGQSPDHVGQQGRSSQDKPPRNMPQINNALDVLGDDSEIELDFGGFGRQETVPSSATPQPSASSNPALRSKDAGKTCKERSNYASFDCAATVLKSNPESKSASAVLIENKDSYMLNICSSPNKFFIVELCDDILIDTIVLANYEFFSSIFRTFRISVSDRYPVKTDRWKELGVFEARNTRSVQAFLVEQPLIWARYLRIEFLTHYSNEYYCPVSLLRVHGTTMMEEFRHQEELARGEISDDLEESVMPDASESAVQEPAQSSKAADSSVVVESVAPIKVPSEPVKDSSAMSTATTSSSTSSLDSTTRVVTDSVTSASPSSSSVQTQKSESHGHSSSTNTSSIAGTFVSVKSKSPQSDVQPTSTPDHTTEKLSSPTADHYTGHTSSSAKSPSNANSTVTPSTGEPSKSSNSTQQTQMTSLPDSANKTVSSSSSSTPQVASNATVPKNQVAPGKPAPASSDFQQKSGTLTVSAAHANPTTQESFFKSIHKRLQMLESNATLSLQYIEEQSRILRDAFTKVEKRQIKKTEAFLENLNKTVSAELQEFRQEYDQLWQSTVIELENHREQYQREILAVSARLSVVADELVFQKRMAVVQSTLLMLCLGLLLFVRTGGGTVDIPILQQMVNKSQYGSRGSYYSPLNSPSPDHHSPPVISGSWRRSRFWRGSVDTAASARPISRGTGNISEASLEEHAHHDNPDLRFDPPTPTQDKNLAVDGEEGSLVSPTRSSVHGEGSVRHSSMESEAEAEETGMASPLDPSLPHETQSSPSTPSGSRDQQTALKMLPEWPLQEAGENVNNNNDSTSTATEAVSAKTREA